PLLAYVALVAAPAEPVWPSTLGMLAGHVAPLAIATDTIGVVRAAPLPTYSLIRLLEWRMAVVTTPCPAPLPQPTQAFSDRLTRDDPVSPAWRGPSVGQSAPIDAPRAPCRLVSTWWPLARSQHRLCGRHGPAATGNPLR